jgi:hypothetical protein
LEERIALDNLKDYLFDCISIRLGVGQYFIDIAPVSPLQTSTKSVSYQALGEVFCDVIGSFGKDFNEFCRACKGFSVHQGTLGDDLTAVLLISPTACRVEIFEPKTDRVDQLMASGTTGVGSMDFQAFSQRSLVVRLGLLKRWDVRRSRRRGIS